MKYFAYGSNCNAAIMKRKGVEFTSRERATLRGYRLKFNKKSRVVWPSPLLLFMYALRPWRN